jgi:hypothetical protein
MLTLKLSTMKKLVGFFLIVSCFSNFNFAYSQCNPDFIYSLLGIPGIWPDANIGIDDAEVNKSYDQTLTVIVPQDTTVDIADFGFPISLLVPVNINSFVVTSISGLPSSFNFECGSANCTYNTGETGCLIIEGTADQSMSNTSYTLTVSLLISIDLNDYGLGDQSFPYDMTGYELYVRPSTSFITEVVDNTLDITSIVDNAISFNVPENGSYILELYDILGKEIYSKNIEANKGKNCITITSLSATSGIGFYSIFNDTHRTSEKSLIN